MANIFNKLINQFAKKSYVSTGQPYGFPTEYGNQTNKDYLGSFDESFLVHACVNKIAQKVANTRFQLFKAKGTSGREKVEEVTNHPLLDLLASVNPSTTKFQLIQLMQAYKELLGNAYWYKARGVKSKKVLELYSLRPDWITIQTNGEGKITNYKYRLANGQTADFSPEDIIHFKQLNPQSSLYGSPTVKSAMATVESSVYSTRWNRNFFKNQAIPATLVITKTKMTTQGKQEFRKRWEDKYQGTANAHKLGFLDGEVEIRNLMASVKDMDFPNLTKSTKEDVLLSFGVPKAILGIEGMNRAEAEALIYTFLSETIEPKIRDMVESLNMFLVPEFGSDLYLDFVDPTPENRDGTTKEYESALKNNWLLINEVRDKEGLPPIDGGWDFYLPISMIPAGSKKEEVKMIKMGGTTKKKYDEAKLKKNQDRLKEKVLTGKRALKLKMELKDVLIKSVKERTPQPMSKKQKLKWWEEHNAVLQSDINLFRVFTRGLLKNQETRIKEGVESIIESRNIKKVPNLVNWDIENRIFFEMSVPVFTDITKRRGKRAADLIGTRFELTEGVVKEINKKAMVFAEEVNSTTKKKLRKALGEGVSAGEGIPQLSDRVEDVFKDRTKYEAERIARTEVSSVSNSAEVEAYKQSGVIEKKEWLAEPDACPICAALSGEIVKVNKTFSDGLSAPPAHPNCRCAILPVIEI